MADKEIKERFSSCIAPVHPDWNRDAAAGAQKALKLWTVWQVARGALDVIQTEEKALLRGSSWGGKLTDVEDDPDLFKCTAYKQTMKLLAELDIKRKTKMPKTHTSRGWSSRKRQTRKVETEGRQLVKSVIKYQREEKDSESKNGTCVTSWVPVTELSLAVPFLLLSSHLHQHRITLAF